MYVIIQVCIITFVLYINRITYSALQVTIYDMYVIVLLNTMWRRLMEIMLMAKLMEIVSSVVVCVSIHTHTHTHTYIIFIYLYTLCKQLIVSFLGIFKTNSG